jgi:hypothetical protein
MPGASAQVTVTEPPSSMEVGPVTARWRESTPETSALPSMRTVMVPSDSTVADPPASRATFCARMLRWSMSSFAERPDASASRISRLRSAIWSAAALTCATERSADVRMPDHCVATAR